jgi:hypothetical protein
MVQDMKGILKHNKLGVFYQKKTGSKKKRKISFLCFIKVKKNFIMSVWTTPLGIAGIVFIVIGIIMAIVGIVLLVLDKDVEKPWYIWVLLAGGIVMGIIGGIMLAVAYSREEPKLMTSMYCGVPTTTPAQPSCAIPMQPVTTYQPPPLRNACISTNVTPAKPIYTTVPVEPPQQLLFTPAPMIQNQTPIAIGPPVTPQKRTIGRVEDSTLTIPPATVLTKEPQEKTWVTLPDGRVGYLSHDSAITETTQPGEMYPADLVNPYTGQEIHKFQYPVKQGQILG